MQKTTFAVIIGNRDFFPGELCAEGRQIMLDVLAEEGYEAICLDSTETEYGSLKTYEDAKKCAALFKKRQEEIDGIVITLPNFGAEKAVVDAIRMSGLDVPILVHAFPDSPQEMGAYRRRDSFCGKISVCNNLRQYGFKFSLTSLHAVEPTSAEFRSDLTRFAAICRIVKGLPKLRVGLIGARPSAFNTVRFSEKLLEANGITVEPIDLLEIVARLEQIPNDRPDISGRIEKISDYVMSIEVPEEAVLKIAKLGIVIEEWMTEKDLNASAIQCWNALEQYVGIVPCTIMSMMSTNKMPSACEADVAGTVSMYILQLASGKPSALVDWNNNFGDNPNKGVVFHCSNFPAELLETTAIDYPPILASTLGKENTYGTISGRLKAGPTTFVRISTNDSQGKMEAYVGEGKLTDDPLDTFGGRGVIEVPQFQSLLQYICANGFEHHVAISRCEYSDAIAEALEKYLEWTVYKHN